jgi:uncharacterized membrane protein
MSGVDQVAREASTRFGGPLGSFGKPSSRSLVHTLRILALLATLTHLLGYVMRLPCRLANFTNADRYPRMCYSDMPYLFGGRGFDVGHLPYLSAPPKGAESLEYPVLTGWFMHITGWLTAHTAPANLAVNSRASVFYDWNTVLLGICLVVAVIAVALTVPGRPWDAALLALAPTIIMTGLINWDLLAVALLAVCMLMWAREKPVWAGVFMGLAVSAKFYPLVILPAFAIVAWRNRRLRPLTPFALAAVAAWAVLNAPFAVINMHEWAYFYTFSREREADFGSVWLAMDLLGVPSLPIEQLNLWAAGVFAVLAAAITVVAFIAKQPPRLAQLAFLFVAAFCVSNKVYSPQYVLWLLPLAALARPRWREYLVWQGSQVWYAVSVWLYLAAGDKLQGLNAVNYAWMILLTIAFTLWFSALIIRDVLRPQDDIVRLGESTHRDAEIAADAPQPQLL